MPPVRKIAKVLALTSGGDSAGMNAALYALARAFRFRGVELWFASEGYKGLVGDEIFQLDDSVLEDNYASSGTRIRTARLPEFKDPKTRQKAISNLKERGIGGVVVIGGDGSYQGAAALAREGVRCVALPGTIDNDIGCTGSTIGFDTTLNTIVSSLDALRGTADAQGRCLIVEVMGRDCGDLAVFAAAASNAELVVTSENPLTLGDIVNRVGRAFKSGRRSVLVIATEYIYGHGGRPALPEIAKAVEKATGRETRHVVLSYVQRGGRTSAYDRAAAFFMAQRAASLLLDDEGSYAVSIDGQKLSWAPLEEAVAKRRPVRAALIDEINRFYAE